jgi:hypothetical protein
MVKVTYITFTLLDQLFKPVSAFFIGVDHVLGRFNFIAFSLGWDLLILGQFFHEFPCPQLIDAKFTFANEAKTFESFLSLLESFSLLYIRNENFFTLNNISSSHHKHVRANKLVLNIGYARVVDHARHKKHC